MCERGWGRIVTTSSGAGTSGVNIGVSPYAAGKGGGLSLTRTLALEIARKASRPHDRARPDPARTRPSRTSAKRSPFGVPARRKTSRQLCLVGFPGGVLGHRSDDRGDGGSITTGRARRPRGAGRAGRRSQAPFRRRGRRRCRGPAWPRAADETHRAQQRQLDDLTVVEVTAQRGLLESLTLRWSVRNFGTPERGVFGGRDGPLPARDRPAAGESRRRVPCPCRRPRLPAAGPQADAAAGGVGDGEAGRVR